MVKGVDWKGCLKGKGKDRRPRQSSQVLKDFQHPRYIALTSRIFKGPRNMKHVANIDKNHREVRTFWSLSLSYPNLI